MSDRDTCEACGQGHNVCARSRPYFADVKTCCCDQPVQVRIISPPSSYAYRQGLAVGEVYEAIDRRYLGDDAVVVNRDGHGVVLWVDRECELVG
jgi:hypothetical protein